MLLLAISLIPTVTLWPIIIRRMCKTYPHTQNYAIHITNREVLRERVSCDDLTASQEEWKACWGMFLKHRSAVGGCLLASTESALSRHCFTFHYLLYSPSFALHAPSGSDCCHGSSCPSESKYLLMLSGHPSNLTGPFVPNPLSATSLKSTSNLNMGLSANKMPKTNRKESTIFFYHKPHFDICFKEL